MVNYPNVLSVQVLPSDLKKIAIERLEAVKLKVPDFKYVKENSILLGITLTQINGVINFINATDQSNKWEECVEFNRRLDVTRNQSFTDTTPEFKLYV
jgi:hypothetical protein